MITEAEQLDKVILESAELADALRDVLFAIHDIKAKVIRNASPADLAESAALHSKNAFEELMACFRNWHAECRSLFRQVMPELKLMERQVETVKSNAEQAIDFFNPDNPAGLLKKTEKVSVDYSKLNSELDSIHESVSKAGIALDKVKEKFEKLRKKLQRAA